MLDVFTFGMAWPFPFGSILMFQNSIRCVRGRIEIHKSVRLWCIVVHFLRQTKAKGWLVETKFHFHFHIDKFCLCADATGHALSLLT